MSFQLTVENPEALTDALDSLSQVASESVLRQATVAAARVVFDEVRLRAPVGDRTYETAKTKHYPGFLRDHILIAFDKERSAEGIRATYLVTWSKEAFYGRFLEFGTSRMAARPFLRPAYDAKKEEAVKKFQEALDEKVREMTK